MLDCLKCFTGIYSNSVLIKITGGKYYYYSHFVGVRKLYKVIKGLAQG